MTTSACWRCGQPLPPNSYDCEFCRNHCWLCQGPLNTDGSCPRCSGATFYPNVTYTWICPKCGGQCQTYGFCPTCGWTAAPFPPASQKVPWRCPGCGRYHAPHIDTCPFCQPTTAVHPPYVVDNPIVYVGDPPWTVTTTSGTAGTTIVVGGDVGDCGNQEAEAGGFTVSW